MGRIVRHAETFVLTITSALAIGLSVAHLLELFPALERQLHLDYSLLAVLLLALIGIHLGSSHLEETKFRDDTLERLRAFSESSDRPAIRVFDNALSLERYLSRRIREAESEVCDLSWKHRISAGFAVGSRKSSHHAYERSVAAAAKRITYREIFVFNDSRRLEKMIRRIEENRDCYSCRYFEDESRIPRLQFVIIDNREVVFFAVAPNATLCALESKELVGVLKPYFEEAWLNAIPIKDGKVVHHATFKAVKEKYQDA